MEKIDICNNALNLVGQGLHIESLNENTKEADSCKRLIDPCIERCLDKYDWSFALKNEVITSDFYLADAVNPPFAYTYFLPVDFRRVNELHAVGDDSGYARKVTPKKHIPYRLYNYNNKIVLCTNQQAPFVLQYQANVKDLTLFSASFLEAVEYLMAGYLISDLQKGVMAENQSIKLIQLAYQALKIAHDNDTYIGPEWIDEPEEQHNMTFLNARGFRGDYGY